MPQWKLHFGPYFALMRTIFTETVTVYFLIYTRKEPAQARNFIDTQAPKMYLLMLHGQSVFL